MKATTYREIVYDILSSLKEVKDDHVVSPNQVLYWIQISSNMIMAQHLEKGGGQSYLNIFSANVKTEKSHVIKKYIDMPASTFDMASGKEIEYIIGEIGDECLIMDFHPVKPESVWRLYLNKDEVPSLNKNRYYYRIGEKIYLLGVEKAVIKKVEIGIYTSVDVSSLASIDDTILLPEEHIEILKHRVLALGFKHLMIVPDKVNDGNSEVNQDKRMIERAARNTPDETT